MAPRSIDCGCAPRALRCGAATARSAATQPPPHCRGTATDVPEKSGVLLLALACVSRPEEPAWGSRGPRGLALGGSVHADENRARRTASRLAGGMRIKGRVTVVDPRTDDAAERSADEYIYSHSGWVLASSRGGSAHIASPTCPTTHALAPQQSSRPARPSAPARATQAPLLHR